MSKKVEYKDLFDEGLFDKAIKGAENLLKSLDKLEEGFKNILSVTSDISSKQPFNDIEALRKREKAIKDNRDAVEGLDKIEKERLKLLEKLKTAQDARAVANEKLKQQIAEQIKQNKQVASGITNEAKLRAKLEEAKKDEAKATASLKLQIAEANRQAKENAKIEGDLGAYAQKSATLNKLRKQYKDLAAAEEATTKEAKELLKEIQALDKELKDLDDQVGQNQRNVGNYNRAVERLRGGLNAIKGTAVFIAFTQLLQLIQQNEKGLAGFQKVLTVFTSSLSVLIDSIVEGFGAFSKLNDNIASTGSIFDGVSKTFKDASDSFKGLTDRIADTINANQKLIDSEINSKNAIAGLTNELAKLIKQQKDLNIISNDSTLSIDEQNKALKESLTIGESILQQQVLIAREQERIANQRAKASIASRKDGQADAALQEGLAQATLERAQAEQELTEFRADRSKIRREILRDELELELDILIDAADNLKTVNERIILDERVSFEERRRLLKETNNDLEESFRESIKVIERAKKARLNELADQKFQERKALASTKENEAERGKLALEGIELRRQARDFAINADVLVAESDTKQLNQRIKNIGLGENIQTRLLEIIRERRTATQDLSEANRDLNESERESIEQSNQNLLVTRALFDLQQKGVNLNRVLKQLEEDRLKAEIEGLQQRLVLSKKGSAEAISIQAELNEKLLQQQQSRLNKQLKAEQQAQQAIIALVEGLADKRFEAQTNAIDRELRAVEQRQEALRAISREGQADAEQALAFEQRKEAELERKREQQARQRARLQLALSAVETYSNKVTAGEENPLQSTITDISVLQAFISSLPAFFSGTENVADSLGAPHLNTQRDGYLIRADGGERIFNNKHNSMLPKAMTNDMVVDYALTAYRGIEPAVMPINVSKGITKAEMEEIMNTAVGKIPRYEGIEYNPIERAIIDTVALKGRREKRHQKTGGIWGK